MDKTEQLGRLYHQINIGDEIQRNNACNEILTLISQTTDPVEKDRLRQSIIYYLIDLGRVYDAEFIIEALKSSTNEDMQMASYFHRIEFLKKFVNDPVQIEGAIKETISFAEKTGNEAGRTDGFMENGKFLARQGKEREAINFFVEVANYAENNHNEKLLAVSKYYLGFCLYHLGYLSMANSFLRESTEIAFRERNHILAQTSETLRAIELMKQGKHEEATVIFQQWENNFGLIL